MIEMLIRYAALILESLDIKITNKALHYFSSLIVNYIDDLFSSLREMMMQQRRLHPGYLDLVLLMRSFYIEPQELLYQLDISKVIKGGPYAGSLTTLKRQSEDLLSELDQTPEEDQLNKNDRDYKEALQLMPLTNKKKFYIQNFLPDFPSDHTYRYSEVYTKKVQDPKQLRQILVHEGNSALKGLLSLQSSKNADEDLDSRIESNGGATQQLLSPPLSPVNPDLKQGIIKKEEAPQSSSEVFKEKTQENDDKDKININLPLKPLDIVEYASKRLGLLKKKENQKQERVSRLRHDRQFVRYLALYKHLSPYSPKPDYDDEPKEYRMDESVELMMSGTMNQEYNTLIKNLGIQKKQKQLRFQEKLKLKKEKQEERKRKAKELEELKLTENGQDEKELNDLDFDNFEFGFDDNFDIDGSQIPKNPAETKAGAATNNANGEVQAAVGFSKEINATINDEENKEKEKPHEPEGSSSTNVGKTVSAQKAPVKAPPAAQNNEEVEFNFNMSDEENNEIDDDLDELLEGNDRENDDVAMSDDSESDNQRIVSFPTIQSEPTMRIDSSSVVETDSQFEDFLATASPRLPHIPSKRPLGSGMATQSETNKEEIDLGDAELMSDDDDDDDDLDALLEDV